MGPRPTGRICQESANWAVTEYVDYHVKFRVGGYLTVPRVLYF